MSSNLLDGGLVEIKEVKQNLIALVELRVQKKTLDLAEKTLAKKVEQKSKSIESEILKSTKNRKADIEKTYDNQISSIRNKKSKVQNIKSKTKKEAEKARFNEETGDLQAESKTLKADRKSIFKQEDIPFIAKNRLFFALFLPKGIVDILLVLLTILLFLFIIPCGVYFLWFAEKSILFLAMFYIIIIVVFGGLYLFTNKLKFKHNNSLRKVRDIRLKLNEIKHEQKRIEKQIKRDHDESQYGLEEYNDEIKQLDSEINNVIEQKKEALSVFENTTKNDIKDEITSRNKEDLESLKSEYSDTYDKNKKNEAELVSLSTKVADTYESYLGKEFMSVEKITKIEDLLSTNKADTIASAIALLKT